VGDGGPVLGKLLIAVGVATTLLGAALLLWGRIPLLGTLPGDITIERGNTRIFLPLGTSILLSLVGTGVFWLLSLVRER
jgi:hypothetical protein